MANRNATVRLGVIGCGLVTEGRHLPALQRLPDVQVLAVADVDSERLHRVASRFRIERCYENCLDLLDDPAIEAVAVCVPAQVHTEVTLAALGAGKHVFIEKPLALTLDDCERLIERAAHSPCKVMVGFNLRWHRLVRQARELLQRGDLGAPIAVHSVFTKNIFAQERISEWRKRRHLGGGILFEDGVHHFDLWRFLLQSEVEEVSAISRSEEWDDESATVTARMANGVLATGTFSQYTIESNRLEIFAEAGCLRLSFYRFDGLEVYSIAEFPDGLRCRLRRAAETLRALPQAVVDMRQGGGYLASFHAEWRHFISAIRNDTPVESTLEDGQRALQVVLAALESASRSWPVKVAEAPRTIPPLVSAAVATQEVAR